jgi:5-methylcytosine-specific restriction endonuclease McrA
VKLLLARDLIDGTPRQGFTPKQRQAVWDASEGLCCGCEDALQPGWHCDHILPLALNGKHDLTNWQALCPSCHRGKTKFDVTRIAKAKRQRGLVEEIQPSKRPIQSRNEWPKGSSFRRSETHKRTVDGRVVPR